MRPLNRAARSVADRFVDRFLTALIVALHPAHQAPPTRTVPAADDWPEWHYAEAWNHYDRDIAVVPETIVDHGELVPEAVAE